MNFTSRIQGIQKGIQDSSYDEECVFNRKKLFRENYLNIQIDDCYDYHNIVEGAVRDAILKLLANTFLSWRNELKDLGVSYYLGIWVYEPRLPKSQVVCAVGEQHIDYYQNQCFDLSPRKENLPPYSFMKKGLDQLKWSQKVDYDYLEQWEIDYPKENYESPTDWEDDQKKYKKFIADSAKEFETKRGKTYCKDVGSIWVGEWIGE